LINYEVKPGAWLSLISSNSLGFPLSMKKELINLTSNRRFGILGTNDDCHM